MMFPAPRCFVLYNGVREYPKKVTLRLSDAFEEPSDGYEWTTIVYNINEGQNPELLAKCKTLARYSELVDNVRQNQKNMDLSSAVDMAVQSAIAVGDAFGRMLQIHRAEVVDVILTEYDEARHEANVKKEVREDDLINLILAGVSEDLLLASKFTQEEIDAAHEEIRKGNTLS